MSNNRMEVDPPASTSSHSGGGTLKRSNSAPMINVLLATSNTETSTSSFRPAEASRIRRFSSSNMALHSTSAPVRVADRINQIKHEESHIPDREAAHERETRSAMQISSSWDGFSLVDQEHILAEQPQRRPRSFSESLHIMTTPGLLTCGSPSPTRVGKQCFSPSMQSTVRNNIFTPSPSPSPTRKTFMRSLSPIAVRSSLGKRKFEPDGSDRCEYLSPPKKFHTGPSTPDRLIAHPLAHSISSSSLEDHSPEQTVPRGPGPVPDRVSHPKAHMFGFMPLRDSHDIHMTDSETSDIAESADMTDPSDQQCHHGNQGSSGFTPIKQTHV